MKILTLAGKEFFHQRHAQTLGSAAFDLSFNQRWIDGTADVMGGGDLQHLHSAQFRIDRNLRQVRSESEYGVGNALAIFIERAGGRIEGGLAGDHVAMLVERQVAQDDGALCLRLPLTVTQPSSKTISAHSQASARRRMASAQFRARHLRGFSGDESLA